jgi:uncharacterized protein
MSLVEKINNELIVALKAGDKLKLSVLRGLKSDIKYKEIDIGEDLKEEDILAVINGAAKKRRDSIEQFKAGNRDDLVRKESSELEILLDYLPEQLSEDKLRDMISESIRMTGADSPDKLGLVMKDIMAKVRGKADGKLVNRLAAEILSGKNQ